MSLDQRLADLGLVLPETAAPGARYHTTQRCSGGRTIGAPGASPAIS